MIKMMSLKECIDIAQINDRDEFFAIELFLSQDGCTGKGVDIINNLLKNKISALEQWSGFVKSNMSIPTSYYYKHYNNKEASDLDYLTRKMQMQMEFNNDDWELMKDIQLPKRGGCFWSDLAEAIKHAQDNNYIPQYFNYHPTESR